MSESNIDPRFEHVVRQTRVVRPPRQTLATFGVTTIRYHLVTEPVYTELDSARTSDEAVVRDGTVRAERPQVVTPNYLLRTEGFGERAREYLEYLGRIHGPGSLGLLYTYKNEPDRMNIVSGGPDEVADRISRDLDDRDRPLEAVIRGVDELWDVSLVKFMFDLTNESVRSNMADLRSSGLLETSTGVPADARRHIDRMFAEARRGRLDPAEIHRELERWDLFEEYQDRFFQLFRNRR